MVDELLKIKRNVYSRIIEHVDKCLPEEGCGLLCGNNHEASMVLPLENVTHSTNDFLCEPNGLIKALELIENTNNELIAIFHSHPNGLEVPSNRDIKEHAYQSAAMLICSYCVDVWKLRCFRIVNGSFYVEISWKSL